MDDEVSVLRRFNRSFTQRVGVLDDSYLGTGRPLGAARVLFELGPGPTNVALLRRRLALDSGYLSRLLRRLEGEGLVTVARDPGDGRRRIVTLTAQGRREWRRLDRRSEAAATAIVDALSERQRADLASALTTAERLMRAAGVEVDRVDPRSDDASDALRQYFGELDVRFRAGFDTSSTDVPGDAAALSAPTGSFLVARADGLVVGCGGVQRVDRRTGEVKRMWVHPEWRGIGLGRRLLDDLEAEAARLGYTRVVLDTNEVLLEAIAMYERAGYEPTDRYNDNPYAHHWFTKNL